MPQTVACLLRYEVTNKKQVQMNTTPITEASIKPTDIVFLRGHKVILRPLCKEDVMSATKWINDQDVTQYLTRIFPMSVEAETEVINEMMKSNQKNIPLAIVADGKIIGIMGIHGIDWINRTATTGAMIGEKEYWGKGYGTDAKMALLEYAFNTLNLRYIMSSVIAYNERSLRYSLHCGYVIEGRRRKRFFKKGRYWDEVVLGLFKKEWLPHYRAWKKKKVKKK